MKGLYTSAILALLSFAQQSLAISVYAENFATPSSTTWSFGSGSPINTSAWSTFTNGNHGARINGGRLEVTSRRSSSAHGQGFAYVACGGTGSQFDNSIYNPVLGSNGALITWTFNMRKAPSNATTSGGFSCSSSANQNGVTIGLGFMLATSSAGGMLSATNNCDPNGTSVGYAVVHGGSNRIRLVRFENGIHNGTLTNIAESQTLTYSNYHSVRVTYDPATNAWTLAVRSDGGSSFADPAAGTFGAPSSGVDATHTTVPLNFMGGYFQAGCIGNCDDASSGYIALFDNLNVDVACVPPPQPGPISGIALVCASTTATFTIDPVGGVQGHVWTFSGSDVLLDQNGTSVSLAFGPASTSGTLSVVSVGDCNSNASTLAIVVQPLPSTPNALDGPERSCAGDVAEYVVVGVSGESYAWTFPMGWTGDATGDSVTTTAVAPGGTITVVGTNTCGSGPAATLNVVVDPLPSVSLNTFQLVCISAAPFPLTGGSPAGGTYTFNGVPVTSFNPVVGLGTYPITYTVVDTNGCAASATQDLVVDACSGITEALELGVRVYPNPVAAGALFVEAPLVGEVTLLDMSGRSVSSERYGQASMTLTMDVSALSSGTYVLHFRTAQGEQGYQRIVVAR